MTVGNVLVDERIIKRVENHLRYERSVEEIHDMLTQEEGLSEYGAYLAWTAGKIIVDANPGARGNPPR